MAEAGGIAAAQLRSIVERIERLEEEKKALADDIRDVYAEAKGNGFDTKTLRTVVRLRKMDRSEREEQDALLDLYLHALGMAVDPEEDGTKVVIEAGGRSVETTVSGIERAAEKLARVPEGRRRREAEHAGA